MRRSILLFSLLFLFACQQQDKALVQENNDKAPLEVLTTENPELKYENLQLFPIVADQQFVEGHAVAASFKNLKEAISNDKFRITEKKPYGRFEDSGAVNSLTVQNKSQDTVFMMSGDVVQGGRQDRVIAMDLVVPPRTITDIPVFCVEQNRWSYMENDQMIDDHQAQQNKKIYAFTGYYNVASNDLRKTVNQSKNQQEVWSKVSQITTKHEAGTSTKAYAGLEQSEEFTNLRNKYLSFFNGKMSEENVVGVIAVSGDQVMGADVFAHPALFQKQFESLLHSYVTDAITNGSDVAVNANQIEEYAKDLLNEYSAPKSKGRYQYGGMTVHFSKF
jgi:hypothetical protein